MVSAWLVCDLRNLPLAVAASHEGDLRRTGHPTQKKSKFCKSETLPMPTAEHVPDKLRDLDVDIVKAVRPVDIDVGVPKRADHGYRVHTAMTRLSLEDPEDKIDEIPSASRKRKAKKAFQFLMQYDNSEYASFVKRRRRFFERHPDADESKVKRPLRFIEEVGVECALWPDLYHHLDLCETAERPSNVRRQQRDKSSAGSSEASQEDPAAPTWRLTGKRFRLAMQNTFIDQIKDGSKTIEERLRTSFASRIAVGDVLCIGGRGVSVVVTRVRNFNTFRDMLQ